MDIMLRDRSLLVTENKELEDICARLCEADWVGVDTEFLRERTYFAKLCLVQLSIDRFECAIDVLALDSLDPLAEMLGGGVRKVLHAARQDFEVLYQSCGTLPAPVFDTQLAAAFCGYPDQIGYAGLVMEELGVALAKQHARTDWTRRPLSAAQMEYALDDVHYLGDLQVQLEEQLVQGGKLAWYQDEILSLSCMENYDITPDQAIRKVKGGGNLDDQAWAVLIALAAWREDRARMKDLPRSWVLGDASLVQMARRGPQTVEELENCEGLKPGFVRRHGEALIEKIGLAIQNAEAVPPSPRLRALTGAEKKHGSALMKEVAARAADLDMAPSLLATRRDVEAFIRAGDDFEAMAACAVMSGWRRDVIGTSLAEK